MNIERIINTYYIEESELKRILLSHSEQVANLALKLAKKSSLKLDEQFIYEAAMLHDIGIFKTHAPGIQCFGTYPYLSHGYLGAEILRKEGYPQHALVCERHTGAGLTKKDIVELNLPIPIKDMMPISLEEQLICFADTFYSKTHLDDEKSLEEARESIAKYSEVGAKRFDKWCELFI